MSTDEKPLRARVTDFVTERLRGYNPPIGTLTRAITALTANDCTTVEDIRKIPKYEWERLPNIGAKTVALIGYIADWPPKSNSRSLPMTLEKKLRNANGVKQRLREQLSKNMHEIARLHANLQLANTYNQRMHASINDLGRTFKALHTRLSSAVALSEDELLMVLETLEELPKDERSDGPVWRAAIKFSRALDIIREQKLRQTDIIDQ